LNEEKRARKALEEWKAENEGKVEELKKKVRMEVETRVKLEEAYQKLEKEVLALREAQGQAPH
jgi:hypothetical protein